ncbi:MAG TPA: radical SAM protein [Candidatus Acidoferrum sp.]|nr:radical SAM protein [Candidatus Acidoferrum sp.]
MATPVMDRLIRRTVASAVPLNIHFDLTYRCNERCVHCYLDHEDHGELTTCEVLEILNQLAEAGSFFLTFSGGEIFLRKDLMIILEHARRLGFDLSLKTNALLVDAERARQLRALGVRRIQVSIYSADPAVHDEITKVRGSLERSLAAIRFLKSEGLMVKIACPLMKQNLASYEQVFRLAKELDVPYVFDLTITPKLDGDTSPLAHRAAGSELLPIIQSRGCADDTRPASPPRIDEDSIASVSSSGIEGSAYDNRLCSAGHNSCYISPYGDVFPCVQLPVPSGNLRRQSFLEIWERSSGLKKIRSLRESQLRICSTCEIRRFCERCPGLAMMEGNDLMGPYERACELAELKAQQAGLANPVSAWHRGLAGRGAREAAHSSLSSSESLAQ